VKVALASGYALRFIYQVGMLDFKSVPGWIVVNLEFVTPLYYGKDAQVHRYRCRCNFVST
jgi:hypothetical protein